MAGCVVEAFWATGIILLAAIAKTVQHWRFIQLAINIPTLATVFYIWYRFKQKKALKAKLLIIDYF